MPIQLPEQKEQIINHFFQSIHPELCQDQFNLDLIAQQAAMYAVAGEVVISLSILELCLEALSDKVHRYAHVDLTAQLAAGNAAQRELATKENAENEQRKRDEFRNRLLAAQEASRPGYASAMEGKEDVAGEQARNAAKRDKAAQQSARHEAFVRELLAANQFLVTTPNSMVKWGSTNDARKQMKDELSKKYPEFKSEIT
jgi:hypothetical protein